MKFTIILALILLSMTASAAHNKKTSTPNAKLGTSFKFDGSNLRGKYQSSLSTTATVENDKFLEDLLSGRTQFEDRSNKERERN